MKKLLAVFLILCMALGMAPAMAEEVPVQTGAEIPDYDELIVGCTTPMSGRFFSEMWGSNTTDMDVRALLHAYNLVEWNNALGNFGIDPSVVSGITATENAAGDRTYNIVLYNDMMYSDGTPITAWDYAFSLLLTHSPQVAEIGGTLYTQHHIQGVEEYVNGQTNVISGVRVLNPYQLSITVEAEALPYFYEMVLLSITPYPISVIAPGCGVADDGNGIYITNAEAFTADALRKSILDEQNGYLAKPSVVSGPYTLTEYSADGSSAVFTMNPYYKGNSEGEFPMLKTIKLQLVDNETMIAKLQSGEIDLLNKCVNANTLDAGMALVAEGAAGVSNYARSGSSFISYNCERPTMADANVRKAIAMCFDKDTFINAYVRNYGLRVDGYYGIGQWMYQLASGALAAPLEEPGEDADKETREQYEADKEAWEELTMDNLPIYAYDVQAAAKLLDDNGWKLDAEGVRAKDGVQLKLKLIYPEGNAIADVLDAAFIAPLQQAGIALTAEAVPFADLLKLYYRQEARDCDMIYLATNFASVFDPAATFAVDPERQGIDNRTGIIDPELYELALDMRSTEPGDVLAYCQKWVAFQQRWIEVLPSIPAYSNVYFDFYTPKLHNYNIGAEVSWAEAVVGAYLSDAPAEEEETGDGLEFFE